MPCSPELIDFICGQIEDTGFVRYRKMFGAYMIYVNDKPIILVTNDTAYVKMLPELADLLENAETGCPFQGAKEHYILDIDNKQLSEEVVRILEPLTAIPKPKKKRPQSTTPD